MTKRNSLTSILLLCQIALFAQSFPQWGNLKPGPYSVGYKVIRATDYSRTYAFKEGRRIPRPLQIYVWYPASTDKASKPMSFGEYFNDIGFDQAGYADPEQVKNYQIAEYRNGPLGPSYPQGVTDEILHGIFSTQTAAHKNAKPASGKFPVLLHMHVSGSTAQSVLLEYLASHGYYVASISWIGTSPAFFGRGEWSENALLSQTEDLMFTCQQLRKDPLADVDNMAMIGMFAHAGTNLQMKEQLLEGIACTDCEMSADKVTHLPFYEARRFTIPLLEFVNSEAQRESSISDSLLFSERMKVTYDISHLDFYPFARIAKPKDASRDLKYEAVAKMTLGFVNAILRNDAGAKKDVQHGLGLSGMTVSLRSANEAKPTRSEFLTWLREGEMQKASIAFDKFGGKELAEKNQFYFTTMFLVRDRASHAFDALRMYVRTYPGDDRTLMMLNGYGYAFLARQNFRLAEEAFGYMVSQFPNSPFAHDAWADYLVASNQNDEALKSSFKVIEMLPSSGLPPQQIEGLRKSAQDKIDRLTSPNSQQKFELIDQHYGPHAVGFKTIKRRSKAGIGTAISLWYPAEAEGKKLHFRDYLLADSLSSLEVKPEDDFKRLAERIYDRAFLPGEFQSVIEKNVHASLDLEMRSGKFPLIISSGAAADYYYLFEYLASHGFVVAAVNTFFTSENPPPTSQDHYSRYTDALHDLLDFMKRQPYTDPSNITAFGHGGGIQSAAYLAMRTSEIKRVINLDGGFFGPRSKTTLSKDYRPEKMKAPFLHIVTVSQQQEDDNAQIDALKTTITKVQIKNSAIRHHDFTGWGLAIASSRNPNEAKNMNETVNAVNELILKFLKNEELTSNNVLSLDAQ